MLQNPVVDRNRVQLLERRLCEPNEIGVRNATLDRLAGKPQHLRLIIGNLSEHRGRGEKQDPRVPGAGFGLDHARCRTNVRLFDKFSNGQYRTIGRGNTHVS